ncbi:MAG: MMPL family transporter [Nitrospirae bacterium]|nr:MMPL family transporter [Nitrospirota bacterium]
MKRYVEAIIRWPLLTILCLLALTAYFGAQVGHLKMVLDPKRILPQEHPFVQLNNKIEKNFGGSRVVVIGVTVKEGDIFNPDTLGKIKRITEAVKGVQGILEENVISIADRKIKYIKSTEDGLDIRRMMDEVPTTPEGLAELRANVFMNDLFVGSLVSRDGKSAAIITDFRGGGGSSDWWDRMMEADAGYSLPDLIPVAQAQEWSQKEMDEWWAKQGGKPWEQGGSAGTNAAGTGSVANAAGTGSVANAPAQPAAASGGDTDWEAVAAQWYTPDSTIYNELEKIAAAERDGNTQVHLGGLPIALAFLEKDALLMNQVVFPIAVAVVLVVLFGAFRSGQGVVIPLLTAALSVVWALGAMAIARIPLDPWTQTLTPILIVAIAAGHSIQILKRYYEELVRNGGDNRAAVVEATSKIGPVMITAGLVASASFASLITFDLKTFQSFGMFTAFGILAALALEMSFIPALRAMLRPPSAAALERLTRPRLADRIVSALAAQAVGEKKPVVLVVVAAALVVSLFASGSVQVNNSLKGQFFPETQLRVDEAAINQAFGGTTTFYVLLEGKEPGDLKDPAVLKAMEALQRKFESVPGVGKTESFVDYIKKMNKSFHADDPAFDAVPDERDQVADFLFLYSISGNPADFRRLVDYDYQRAVLWAFLKDDSTLLAQQLIDITDEFVKTEFPEGITAGVAGSSPVTVALNDTIVDGKLRNIVQIAMITFVISCVVLRSLLGGLLVLVPLGAAVLINFGIMGLFGITLGIGTATITAMAVGIGADFAIYILFRCREEFARLGDPKEAVKAAVATAGKAVLFVALAIGAGCATLSVAGYYRHMEGVLIPLAMLTGSMGALTILPTIAWKLRPEFIFRRG